MSNIEQTLSIIKPDATKRNITGSINKIIENKKYKPPNHWDDERQSIKLSSKCLIFSNTVNPVEVKPDTDSKYAFAKVIL